MTESNSDQMAKRKLDDVVLIEEEDNSVIDISHEESKGEHGATKLRRSKRTKLVKENKESNEKEPNATAKNQSGLDTTPLISNDLFKSVASSLSKELQDQLASSSDLIAQLAAKMAEEMLARKMKDNQKPDQHDAKGQTDSKSKNDTKNKNSRKDKIPDKKSKKISHEQNKSVIMQASPSKTQPTQSKLEFAQKGQAAASKTHVAEDENEKESRLKKKEEERLEREKKKEEERLEREKKKEEERLEREKKKEEERQKKEEERLEREKKKEEERLEREKKKEEERLEREHKKQLEKLEKERKREEERQKKEDQKKKEQEAKERKQSRIGSFFTVQKKSANEPKSSANDNLDTSTASCSATKVSDYDKTFLGYYKRANVEIHLPLEGCQREDYKVVTERMDTNINSGQDILSWIKSQRCARGFTLKYTADDIVNLANSGTATEHDIETAFQTLPLKHLQFGENIRPPYFGTFTKTRIGGIPAANPFFTTGTGLNYGYDSDIEWTQEDEEGEDLDNMDDESDEGDLDDDDENEMSDFVSSDDADGSQPQQRKIIGPLKAFISFNDGTNDQEIFNSVKVDVLSYNNCFEGISPFQDYWTPPSVKQIPTNGTSVSGNTKPSTNGIVDVKKLVPKQEMRQFFEKIQGQKFNQTMLVEILKQEFPQYTKEMIKTTVKEVARRAGEQKEWEIKPEALELYK